MKKSLLTILAFIFGFTSIAVAERQPNAGFVVKVNPPRTHLELSLGTDDGLKIGDTMLVKRAGTIIGLLKITDVEDDRAVAKVVDVKKGYKIINGDKFER